MTSIGSSDTEVATMLHNLSQRITLRKPVDTTAAGTGTGTDSHITVKAAPAAAPAAAAAVLNGAPRIPSDAATKTATATATATESSEGKSESETKPYVYKREIVWFNAIGFLILHIGMLYGVYLGLFEAYVLTDVWSVLVGFLAAESILLGAHRYYTHRAYKATLPLRILIVWWQTVASQNCLWVWVRDHRQHHKYSDTNADPHNATRGFFFSHIGWLMVRKHPDVFTAGKKVDMSDIEADPLVMFQKKYYKSLYFVLAILFPTVVPVYCWGETWWNSFFIAFMARTFVSLNFAWMVNSWAHLYGTHPFDKGIMPSESRLVSLLTFGEGWHNFHHTFPWDYRASEFGQDLNLTCSIIEMFERWGWAYDLKAAPEELVRRRVLRTGDGSHPRYNKNGVPAHLIAEPDPEFENINEDDGVEVCSPDTETEKQTTARPNANSRQTINLVQRESRKG